MVDWTTAFGSGFTPPAPNASLGLLGNPYQYLGDLGFGLLAQSGPSLEPRGGFGAQLGRAGQYASERRDQGLLNEARRMEISSAAQEQVGLANFQKWATDNPKATDQEFQTAASRFMPALAIKSRLSNILSPADQANLLNTQATLLKIKQELEAKGGESLAESAGAFGNIKSIASASERLDEANSLFTPGGLVEKAGGLDLAAAGLTTLEATGYGTESTKKLVNQVTDAQTVSKATAALAQGLQGAASSSSRSAYALRNIQTALGQNMIWPAKRRILVQNLDTLFLDAEAQGLEKSIPDYQSYKDLYAELKKQDEAFTKRNEPAPDTAAAPPAAAPAGAAPAAIPGPTTNLPAAVVPPPAPPMPMPGPGAAAAPAGPGLSGLPAGFASVMPSMSNLIDQGGAAVNNAYEAVRPTVQEAYRSTADKVYKATRNAPSVPDQLKNALPADGTVARKVGSLSLNAAGKPVFKYMGDAQRALERGLLDAYNEIVVGGKTVDIK